ncbi:MAG: hypothetical protein IKW45_05440 [Clostridia bacterium]|nr:hypothetical protein [Clostridia bacterium]
MADNRKIKISQNPQVAFLQGKAVGEKNARAEDIKRGMNLCASYILLAMAWVNDRSQEDKKDYLSKPAFREFYNGTMKRLWELIENAIKGEEGIDLDDIAMLYCGHDEFIRERYGLAKKNYDGKDEVL